MVSEVRRNHVLERELNKLDKRIALLIKNRGNIQDVLAASHGVKRTKTGGGGSSAEVTSDPRKLEVNLLRILFEKKLIRCSIIKICSICYKPNQNILPIWCI